MITLRASGLANTDVLMVGMPAFSSRTVPAEAQRRLKISGSRSSWCLAFAGDILFPLEQHRRPQPVHRDSRSHASALHYSGDMVPRCIPDDPLFAPLFADCGCACATMALSLEPAKSRRLSIAGLGFVIMIFAPTRSRRAAAKPVHRGCSWRYFFPSTASCA